MNEIEKCKIIIPGNLIPWRAHAGYGRKSFNPLFKEREFVQWHIKSQWSGDLLTEAICVRFTYYVKIPNTTSKKNREKMQNGEIRPIKRPDLTNLCKFYEDCLKNVVISDDSLIVEQSNSKFYADEPSVIIQIFSFL